MKRFKSDTSASSPDSVGGEAAARPGPGKNKTEVAAVRLLARREHSTAELRRKLLAKGHPEASVAAVMEKLGTKRLVSDERFVTSFVHHHARRGQGPIRIRAELRQQGIADAEVQQALETAEVDWNQLAAQVRLRKFGASPPRSPSERAKQARFLQYRGFGTDHIRAALLSDPELADSHPADPDLEAGFDGDPS